MLVPAAKNAAFPVREDRAVRGRRVAERMGCFGCHGADGVRGIANPGSKDGVVPALAGGEMMMWAHDEAELRSWILDGGLGDATSDVSPSEPASTERGAAYASSERSSSENAAAHARLALADAAARGRAALAPLAAGRGSGRVLVMPAYHALLSREELDDLVTYLKSISGLQFPDGARAAKGLEKMHELGCFSCHGPMGIGGRSNPRSLKGYVPGFGGEDYRELVRDGNELREWIRNGATERFARNPLARAVMTRQALKMPAYGEHLDDTAIETVASAVEWLADGDWRDQPVP